MNGDVNLIVEARTALLDALAALAAHRASVILVGAQAVYLHTGHVSFAIAEATKDSDLVLDPRTLGDAPQLDEVMAQAGFHLDPTSSQPGAWISPRGIPVDLMVPEYLAGAPGRRAARIPPHGKRGRHRNARSGRCGSSAPSREDISRGDPSGAGVPSGSLCGRRRGCWFDNGWTR